MNNFAIFKFYLVKQKGNIVESFKIVSWSNTIRFEEKWFLSSETQF